MTPIIRVLILLCVIHGNPVIAADKPREDLTKIEADLKENSDDPMLHYRKCQALFASGKEQEAIDYSTVALKKFKESKDDLAWMLLGSIATDDYKIDVHYNMGDRERADKKEGIVRPLSFRVWTKANEPKLVRILDFELAYFEGELISAAIGEKVEDGHANLGIVDPKSNFNAIKKRVLEIVRK